MSQYQFYGSIFKEVKEKFKDKNIEQEVLTEELYRQIEVELSKKWVVGFKDRGMGHGDYGVIVEDSGRVVVECGILELAQHIVDSHNLVLEGKKDK